MISATEALARLKEGNRRWVDDIHSQDTLASGSRRRELAAGQAPYAVILGCSDSRAPAELLFDQGLGDLFVIRVAGNVVAPSHIGSIEFATEQFDTHLVVVLGHSHCGAVKATLDELARPAPAQSPNLKDIVERIRPSVEGLTRTDLAGDPEALLREAVRANVRASVRQVQEGSEIIRRHIRDDGLLVVGAEYSLETGAVDFFEGVPG
jgi:carbonic anhydrase